MVLESTVWIGIVSLFFIPRDSEKIVWCSVERHKCLNFAPNCSCLLFVLISRCRVSEDLSAIFRVGLSDFRVQAFCLRASYHAVYEGCGPNCAVKVMEKAMTAKVEAMNNISGEAH